MAVQHPRVGVFLCRCRGSYDDCLDIDAIAEEVARLKNVKHVEVGDCMCNENAVNEIQKAIDVSELDSIVIGGCADQIDLKTLRQSLRDSLKEIGDIGIAELLGPSLHAHGESFKESTQIACQAACDAISEAGLITITSRSR